MIDWIVTNIVEWWLLPGWLAKAGILAIVLALLSALVTGIGWIAKAVAWLYGKATTHERRAPQEGLTASGPLPTPKFTGREQEKASLLRLIAEHQVCAVAGPPLIGKSWLISEALRSGGREPRCIFIEMKPGRGLSALLFAINAGLMRLGCFEFDGVCGRDDLTPAEKVQELRSRLEAGEWVIVLDAYERVEAGGEVDRTIESWGEGLGKSHVVLGTRRTPRWLAEAAVLQVPEMPPGEMHALCRRLGLTEAEAGEVCDKLAGLPGAAGVFRGVCERKGPAAAKRLVGKKPEKLGRQLFDAAFRAAPPAAQEVWMAASWFPQPLRREAVSAICGEEVFREGVALLERWTVVTEGAKRLALHAWAIRTGQRARRWQWGRRRVWGPRAAAYYAQFAKDKAADRAALEAELENLLAAARLAFQYQEWQALWGMGYALDEPLMYAGRWTAREELLRLCADGAAKARNLKERAAFTHHLGTALRRRGELEAAERLFQESLEIKREVGDRPGEVQTLDQLGRVAQWRGNVEAAAALYQQSLEIARQVKDQPGEAQALHQLGRVAQIRGKSEAAEDLYNQALEIKRELRDRPGQAHSLHQLGWVAQDRGKLEVAEDLYNQALEIKREVGDRPGEAQTLHELGRVAQNRRKPKAAEDLYQQSLEIEREVGDRPGEAMTLWALALLAEQEGNLRLAVERVEQAHRMFAEMGLAETEQAKRVLDRLRKRLAEERAGGRAG